MGTGSEGRRYTLLLAVILLTVLVLPALQLRGATARWTAFVLLSALLAAILRAAGSTRRARALLITAAAIAFVGAGVAAATEMRAAYLVRFACTAAFYGLAVRLLLHRVLASGRVTGARVTGAVCVYMLLGLLWASLYGLEYVAGDSYRMTGLEVGAWSQQLTYFSFVTLTTLGYGDMTPTSPITRSLAIAEAATGVLYVAVLVARLVALQIVHEMQPDDQSNSS